MPRCINKIAAGLYSCNWSLQVLRLIVELSDQWVLTALKNDWERKILRDKLPDGNTGFFETILYG